MSFLYCVQCHYQNQQHVHDLGSTRDNLSNLNNSEIHIISIVSSSFMNKRSGYLESRFANTPRVSFNNFKGFIAATMHIKHVQFLDLVFVRISATS